MNKLRVKLIQAIKWLLSKFDIVVVRRSSFENLAFGKEQLISLISENGTSEIHNLIGMRFDSVHQKIDEIRKELLRQQISIKWDIVDNIERMIAQEDEIQACPLCGHEDSKFHFPIYQSQCIFGGGRLTRFQCTECELIYGAKKMLSMNSAELSQDYECHYKIFNEGDSTDQEIRAFHLLRPVRQGIYLNYGAGGWSKSVEILRSQGWNVFAFEPHDSAAFDALHLIRNKNELRQMRFDGIFSNNVLEHLRYPVEELNFMKEILKKGARMAHATPCFEYLYEYTRFHLFFYLGRSRVLLAEKAGLVISDFVADGEFMCALYEKKNP